MKTLIMAAALLLAGTANFAQETRHSKHKTVSVSTKYTCTMHPEIVRSKPGKCPKCGMALVAMKETKTKTKMKM